VFQLRQDDSSLGVLSRWEEGCEVKIPSDILSRAGFISGDRILFKIEGEGIVISKANSPREGTLERLFKDYDGGSFQTSLIELEGPVGEEKW
jgi:antitoxin component of MazEF toxin-antitoxin module